MAYNQKILDEYRADALAGRPFRSKTCPYCTGERDATVKHVHPSTKPSDPWQFWRHVILDKYRATQSPAARKNMAMRFTHTPTAATGEGAGEGPLSPERAFVVGPMVDQSELPFRMLCREYGATLAYTPMLHARSFADGATYRRHFFTTTPPAEVAAAVKAAKAAAREGGEEDGNSRRELLVDRPCIVQFCGHEADTVLAAARYAVRGEYTDAKSPDAVRGSPFDTPGNGVDDADADTTARKKTEREKEEKEAEGEFYYYCDAVDLNLGCPQGIARRGHYGSFLMEDWDLVHTIIHTLHVELEVPVTVKIRVYDRDPSSSTGTAAAGAEEEGATTATSATAAASSSFGGKEYDELLSVQYARMVRDAGAQLICVHGRTREMKGQQSGLANFPLIRAMREALAGTVPVISNGNVLEFGDVVRAIEATGCEGHMCAEPLLWDPALFANPPHPVLSGRLPTGATKPARLAGVRTALDYVRWLRAHPVDIGFAKAHLFKMCFHSYELHTAFRDELGRLSTSSSTRGTGHDVANTDGGDNNGCECAAAVAASDVNGDAVAAHAHVAALEAHLQALLAAEEASDVEGAQPKTAQAEKKAAKAQIIDVFEDEGGLCIDF